MLDANELFHLGLQTMQQGNTEQAMIHLKSSIELDSSNANAHYLLGALHAEISMYDRAKEEMALALELDPGITTARFQLGLLHLTAGDIALAEEVWAGLDALGNQHPHYLFKNGMLQFAKEEFADAIESLEAGIASNTENVALNNDMQKILNDAKQAIGQSTDTPAPVATEEAPLKSVNLSVYDSDDD